MHQLAVHTVGGVITQSEPIMLIVPEGDALVIEAKQSPQDIGHVKLEQQTFIRFPAVNQRTRDRLFPDNAPTPAGCAITPFAPGRPWASIIA